MSITSVHPQYSLFLARWTLLRDCYEGEAQVKRKRTLYLPATANMEEDGAITQSSLILPSAFAGAHFNNGNSDGERAYRAYLMRAVYHNFVAMAVTRALGAMHRKPATIELPAAMDRIRENATIEGDSLNLLLMKINQEQLITGRIGLLLDFPAQRTLDVPTPYIATYSAERIRNWDAGRRTDDNRHVLNLVVLDESEFERGDAGSALTWTEKNKYRALVLGDIVANETTGLYQAGVFDENQSEFSQALLRAPNIRGNTLDQIPFVFVNSMDLLPKPFKPPLETLGNLSMTIYRGEADYRQSLFMQGQDTLVTIGGPDDDTPIRTGAGQRINISSVEGDAKFIGVESGGLAEQRSALENDIDRAEQQSGQLRERSRQVRSGDAERRRATARNASITDVAITGAAGLEKLLKIGAEWLGADPEQVSVQPNLDFQDDLIEASELTDWMIAKNQGLPLSLRSIWETLKRRELTNFETFEDEIAQIAQEGLFGDGTRDTGPDGTGGGEVDPGSVDEVD